MDYTRINYLSTVTFSHLGLSCRKLNQISYCVGDVHDLSCTHAKKYDLFMQDCLCQMVICAEYKRLAICFLLSFVMYSKSRVLQTEGQSVARLSPNTNIPALITRPPSKTETQKPLPFNN